MWWNSHLDGSISLTRRSSLCLCQPHPSHSESRCPKLDSSLLQSIRGPTPLQLPSGWPRLVQSQLRSTLPRTAARYAQKVRHATELEDRAPKGRGGLIAAKGKESGAQEPHTKFPRLLCRATTDGRRCGTFSPSLDDKRQTTGVRTTTRSNSTLHPLLSSIGLTWWRLLLEESSWPPSWRNGHAFVHHLDSLWS